MGGNEMPIYLTKIALKDFKIELKNLKEVERDKVKKRLSFARELGDLKENSDYHAAKERLGRIDSRINFLEGIILEAQVIENMQVADTSKIYMGSKAEILDMDTKKKIKYYFVSEYEADLEKGKINLNSPIGRNLLAKGKGDTVEVPIPAGKLKYKVLKVWR